MNAFDIATVQVFDSAQASASSANPGSVRRKCCRTYCTNVLELGSPYKICRECREPTKQRLTQKREMTQTITTCMSCFITVEIPSDFHAGQVVMCKKCYERRTAAKTRDAPTACASSQNAAPQRSYTTEEIDAIREADAFTLAAAPLVHPAHLDVLINSNYRKQLNPLDTESHPIVSRLEALRRAGPVLAQYQQRHVIPRVPLFLCLNSRGEFVAPDVLSSSPTATTSAITPSAISPITTPSLSHDPISIPAVPRHPHERLVRKKHTRLHPTVTQMCMTFGCGKTLTDNHPFTLCAECMLRRERSSNSKQGLSNVAAQSPLEKTQRATLTPTLADATNGSFLPSMPALRTFPSEALSEVSSAHGAVPDSIDPHQLLATDRRMDVNKFLFAHPDARSKLSGQQSTISVHSAPSARVDVPVSTSSGAPRKTNVSDASHPLVRSSPVPTYTKLAERACCTPGCTGAVPPDSPWGRCVLCGLQRLKARLDASTTKSRKARDESSATAQEQPQKAHDESTKVHLSSNRDDSKSEGGKQSESLAKKMEPDTPTKDDALRRAEDVGTATAKKHPESPSSSLLLKSSKGPMTVIQDKSDPGGMQITSPARGKSVLTIKLPTSPVKAKPILAEEHVASPVKARLVLANKQVASPVHEKPRKDRRRPSKVEDRMPTAPVRERLILRIPARPRPAIKTIETPKESSVSTSKPNSPRKPIIVDAATTADQSTETVPALSTEPTPVSTEVYQSSAVVAESSATPDHTPDALVDDNAMVVDEATPASNTPVRGEGLADGINTREYFPAVSDPTSEPTLESLRSGLTESVGPLLPEKRPFSAASPISSSPPPVTSSPRPMTPASSSSPMDLLSSAVLAWDSDDSDLTPLEDSMDENESEVDRLETDKSDESDEEPLLLAYTKSRHRRPPRRLKAEPRVYYTRCHVLACQNLIVPGIPRNMCELCRERTHKSRKAESPANPELPPGHRLCALRWCYNIIPPIWEYRWKMCEPCRTRARERERRRKLRLLDIDNSNVASLSDSGVGEREQERARRSHYHKRVYTGNDTKNDQSSDGLAERATQYQHLTALLDALRLRFHTFMLGQIQYLRFKFHSHAQENPTFFGFDGEYSVVADPAGGIVDALVQGVVGEIQAAVGMDFQRAGIFRGPDYSVVTRFGCLHEVQVPVTQAEAPSSGGAGPTEMSGLLVKRMVGEAEIAVSWDRTHKFFPGQRIVVRFRLVG